MERTLKILVVDDEQIILDSINKHLRKDNFQIITVHTARAGLDLMENEKIDIILTDLMMPEIDGLEMMKRVKKRWPEIPMVMITGYATINTALEATRIGAFDYIAKPFTKTELRAVVNRAADLVRAADAIRSEDGENKAVRPARDPGKKPKSVGDNVWIELETDGNVLIGVERSFLMAIGKIHNLFLPSVGDELRQGSVYLQVISSDLRSHAVLSPLSGTVVSVNQRIIDDPVSALSDPYGEGWMIRLKPARFEIEVQELGL